MMVSICPTVMADDPHLYRQQMEKVAVFTRRVHIDLSDGTLAPNKLLDMDKIWWPANVRADLHLMLENPFDHIELYRVLSPQLVIVHAEAKGDFSAFADAMHHHGIETGIALLADTPVESILSALDMIDHVMIFSGNLGHFGGEADLSQLTKVRRIRQAKPRIEIGWDGGINVENAAELVRGGVEVLNVGGYIHRSPDPAGAYEELVFATMPKT
jgi:ribulose-phosphate 3-epimerase